MSKYAKAASKTFAKRLACIIINEWRRREGKKREGVEATKIAMAVINAFRVGQITLVCERGEGLKRWRAAHYI